jgi:hypothetical protein
MLLTLLDLPPPSALAALGEWNIPPPRLFLTVRKHDIDFVLCCPVDRVAEWIKWRSTIYRIRYYEVYSIRYFQVHANDLTILVKRKQFIHLEWMDAKFEQLI